MKHIFLAFSLFLPASLPALAGGGSEALKAGSSLNFSRAMPSGSSWRLTRLAASQDTAVPASPQGNAQSRYIRVTGYLSLSGSAHIPQGSNGTFVTLSGYTQLQDERGRYLAGSVHFTDSSFYHSNGNHVSGWARPSAQISIYENGRYLGSVRVDGSIYVSGWNNGGWVHLNGSGQVSGSGYIQDYEPPQTP